MQPRLHWSDAQCVHSRMEPIHHVTNTSVLFLWENKDKEKHREWRLFKQYLDCQDASHSALEYAMFLISVDISTQTFPSTSSMARRPGDFAASDLLF